MTDDAIPSVRAIVCTAHLMLAQNPKAAIYTEADWRTYLALIRDWCERFTVDGVAVYWSPGIHEGTRH